jgi:hypothetical protein
MSVLKDSHEFLQNVIFIHLINLKFTKGSISHKTHVRHLIALSRALFSFYRTCNLYNWAMLYLHSILRCIYCNIPRRKIIT